MDKVILSVIIPCFNDGRYLREALESIPQYKDLNYEVIIVDDGSDEQYTIKVLDELKKEGCKVIWQENKGPSSARNAGIKEAKGEFILLLDADNKIDPEYIKRGLNILQSNPEVGVVYSDYRLFGGKKGKRRSGKFDIQRLLYRNYIDTCALIRKKAWEEVGGFDANLDKYIWEDWVFWLDVYYKGWKFYYIPAPLFFYRVKKESRNKIADNDLMRQKLWDYISRKFGNHIYREYRKLYRRKRRWRYLIRRIITRIKKYYWKRRGQMSKGK